jgi:hypothetical protein
MWESFMSEHAIDIRQMPASEIGRLAEIDRTEQIRLMYKMIDGKLIAQAVDIQASNCNYDIKLFITIDYVFLGHSRKGTLDLETALVHTFWLLPHD